MKRVLIASAIALVLVGCKEKVELPSASIKIELPNGLGSGTKIGDKLILTAAHVVDGQTGIKIKTEDGAIVDGRVIFVDKAHDLALVEADVKAKTAKVKCDVVKPGTEFSIYGNPLGLEFTYSWGRIASKPKEFGPWGSAYTVDATIIMGNSGGGAFDDFGRVIGVVVGIRLAPLQSGPLTYTPSVTGFGFVVDGPTVCKFLDENKVEYRK